MKNTIEDKAGTLYIGMQDGKQLILGKVGELEYTEMPDENILGLTAPLVVSEQAGIDFEVTMSRQQIERFLDVAMGITRIVYEMIRKYKNGDRVCYLAMHHKKNRVRKKNRRRAYRMAEKEARKQ